MVLVGASCWQSSNCIPAQKIVSVLTVLFTTVQHWCWAPTMVCAVTTPLHSLPQGSPNYGPRAKSNLRSHFTRAKHILPIMKKYIYEKCVDLAECSISLKSHITQGVWPSNCCAISYVVSLKKIEEPWSI